MTGAARASVTICIACRDERGNIEALLRAMPRLAEDQEILFVEGHSTDGTRAEIERCIAAYPQSNIRLIGQPGYGKADAVRAGFRAANGAVIVLLEGDMTSSPMDVVPAYEAICSGEAGFVLGSRLARPLFSGAMPLINQFGNRAFALWFSLLVRQRLTDVLCGIKALRKADYERMEQRWGGTGIEDPFGDFEMLLGAFQLGLTIVELPVSYRTRVYGASKTRVFYHGAILCRIALQATAQTRA